jgi:hypothetical protein
LLDVKGDKMLDQEAARNLGKSWDRITLNFVKDIGTAMFRYRIAMFLYYIAIIVFGLLGAIISFFLPDQIGIANCTLFGIAIGLMIRFVTGPYQRLVVRKLEKFS